MPRAGRGVGLLEGNDVVLAAHLRPAALRLAAWLRQAGVLAERVEYAFANGSQSGMWFGNSALAYQAAIDGIGVASAQAELVRDDLASGWLVPAHLFIAPSGETYHLASADTPAVPGAAAFREWIFSKGSLLAA